MSIVLTGLGAAFVAVQKSYQGETYVKALAENARSGIGFLERSVRMTGYGVEPRFAIDMEDPPGLPSSKDNYAGGTFVSDDFAFRFRDPTFLRRGQLAAGSLTLEGDSFGVPLRSGQMMMVACAGATDYAVVRLSAAVTAADVTVAAIDHGAPFTSTTNSCLSNTGNMAPYLFLVHEYRLRVIEIDQRPWLVAFRDLSEDVTDPASTYDPIAVDVENFQVSYVMARPQPGTVCCAALAAPDATGNDNWILGDDSSVVFPSIAAQGPTYDEPYDSELRFTVHPGNIRGVRLSLGLRSHARDPSRGLAASSGPQEIENYTPSSILPDGYYRNVITTNVRMPNMLSRSFFVPSLRASGSTIDLNTWGG